jgi:hypothetical protein
MKNSRISGKLWSSYFHSQIWVFAFPSASTSVSKTPTTLFRKANLPFADVLQNCAPGCGKSEFLKTIRAVYDDKSVFIDGSFGSKAGIFEAQAKICIAR